MKIKANSKILKTALSIVSKGSSRKTTEDPLAGILLETVGKNHLKLTTNSRSCGIETTISAQILESGKICLKEKIFHAIIDDEDDVIISSDVNKTVITQDKNKTVLPNIKEGNQTLPLPEKFSYEFYGEIDIPSFLEEVSKVSFLPLDKISSNGNETYKGIWFDIHGNTMTCTASDGHRIGQVKVPMKEAKDFRKGGSSCNFIIEKDKVTYLMKILPESGTLRMYLNNTKCMFVFDNTKYMVLPFYKKAPNTEMFFSFPLPNFCKFEKAVLMKTLERGLLLSDGNKKMIFELKDHESNLSLSSEYGKIQDTLVTTLNGEEVTVALNPKSLLEMVKYIKNDSLELLYSDSMKPIKIMDEKTNYIILPIAC